MSKIKQFFSRLVKNVWFGIKTSFLASKFYFSMKLLILFSTTAIPLVNIWLWKEVLNGIVNYQNSNETIIVCLSIYLFLLLVTYLFNQFDSYINNRYSDELQFYIEMVMMEKTSRMDLSFFDSAEMGDKVRHARRNFGVMTQMAWTVFDILSASILILNIMERKANILAAFLRDDSENGVACEVAITTDMISILGKISCNFKKWLCNIFEKRIRLK